MKVQIMKGVMIKGTPVFPTIKSADGKKDIESIVDVSSQEARVLIGAGQAKPVDKKAKVTIEIKDPESTGEDAALDEFFGDDDEE